MSKVFTYFNAAQQMTSDVHGSALMNSVQDMEHIHWPISHERKKHYT